MSTEYVHLKLGEDIRALAGYYTPDREEIMKFNGHDVLYAVGGCTIESSCCGGSGCMGYVTVPGYLVSWKKKINGEGLAVSEVDRIPDENTRNEIRKIIRQKENISNIDFW